MHIGIMLQNYTLRGGAVQLAKNLATAATSAEAAGVDNIWVLDHFMQIPPIGPAETDMLESYSVLNILAAHTKHVCLGTLVTGVTYRYPGLLVKTATTLDVLSGAGPGLASARPGSSGSIWRWVCRFRRSGSVLSALRKRCRSRCRCGRRKMARTTAATTSSRRPCACPNRFPGRGCRS